MNKLPSPLSSIRQADSDEIIQLLRIQTDALRTLCVSDYPPQQIEALIERNLRHFSLGGCQSEFILVAPSRWCHSGLVWVTCFSDQCYLRSSPICPSGDWQSITSSSRNQSP